MADFKLSGGLCSEYAGEETVERSAKCRSGNAEVETGPNVEFASLVELESVLAEGRGVFRL